MARLIFISFCVLLVNGSPLPSLGAVLESERQYLSGRGKDDAVPWRFLGTTGAPSGFWTNLPGPSNWEMQVSLPPCGLGFLHGIPPIGTQFTYADQGGPQGQPNPPNGEYSGALHFYFGSLHRNP